MGGRGSSGKRNVKSESVQKAVESTINGQSGLVGGGTRALPKIEGVSEKQVQFAESVRDKHLKTHQREVKVVEQILKNPTAYKSRVVIDAVVKQANTPKGLKDLLQYEGVWETYIALTSKSARTILDTLRRSRWV